MERLTDWAEGLLCPVLLCDPEGKILYRNDTAKSCRLGGRVGSSLFTGLSEEDAVNYRRSFVLRRCDLLELPSKEGTRKVLFCPILTDSGRCVLLLGYAMLQSASFSRAEGQRLLASVGKDLSAWLLRPEPLLVREGQRRGLRLYDLHARLVSMYLGGVASDRPASLAVVGSLLRRFSADACAFCGSALRIEIQSEEPERIFLSNVGGYLSYLIALGQAMVRLGGYGSGKWIFYCQGERLVSRLELRGATIPVPDPFPADLPALAEMVPTLSADLLLLNGIGRTCSYQPVIRTGEDSLCAAVIAPKFGSPGFFTDVASDRPSPIETVAAFAEFYFDYLRDI